MVLRYSPLPAEATVEPEAPTTEKARPQHPPPKTDKPRPHVCGNCGRAFARLEHLKRHERSHTKEKPFECPECTRCFARRDLLLRHQQKLHYQQSASSRPRNARRESVSGTSTSGTGRVRKNSVANNTAVTPVSAAMSGMRPRASTLGHLDLASLGLVDGFPGAASRVNLMGMEQSHRMSTSGVTRPDMNMHNISSPLALNLHIHNLPKLDTNPMHTDVNPALRTAPPMAGSGGFQWDQLFPDLDASTVNPAQLHFGNGAEMPQSPFPNFPPFDATSQNMDQSMEQSYNELSWMNGVDNPMMAASMTIDGTLKDQTPFQMDHFGANGNFSHPTLDLSFATGHVGWPMDAMAAQPLMTPAAFHMDTLGSDLPILDGPHDTVSPQNLHDSPAHDPYFGCNIPQSNHDMNGAAYFVPPAPLSNFDSDSPSMSSSMTGSARQSSVTSVSTDSITDATRQALLNSLSQPSTFGHNHRKYSQPSISSPLSPSGGLRNGPTLPSTSDLQRYVNAYINYFHPHLPFLHIPTLSFESTDYSSNLKTANIPASFQYGSIVGGGGCLILAMAAIGALYEYDHQASKELFDNAKRMIGLYLEERRKADMSAAVNGSFMSTGNSKHNTPLWLVQAMLLNVIYGHQCGDKRAADIASTHAAALVSLARAAELAQPFADGNTSQDFEAIEEEASMQSPFGDNAHNSPQSATHLAWCKWKDAEERKRTLFVIFILSSLLVTAYNQSPAIMNSEILLDLPCEEDLWAAENASDWLAKGGTQAARKSAHPFAAALSALLTASQKTKKGSNNMYKNAAANGQHLSSDSLRPSTFGCLVLINALHNYIWETRTRHHGRQWTAQETEAMVAHIEPALNAWQRAWKANDRHHLQRPNPFNCGPLSADSIPLLDLAFVRLFVNLGRNKEAFWLRDFDAMAVELTRLPDMVQYANTPGAATSDESSSESPGANGHSANGSVKHSRRFSQASITGPGSKREKHLRKAACYAADSLSVAAKFGLTYADNAAHQLPIQSAMCFFDCGQVLAEWSATVQERVGRYLGVLGRDDIDYTQVPAIMLLEAEDIDLLKKIDNICRMLEDKMVQQANLYARDFGQFDSNSTMNGINGVIERLPGLQECGLSSKILKVTALMLEKDATWPSKLEYPFSMCKKLTILSVTHLMANALQVHTLHMNQRAEASLTASDG